MAMGAEDVIGVECEKCHRESFRLVERKILVEMTLKCCPTCARRIDAAADEQTEKDAIALLTKSERRRFFQEKSFEWASNLHGKRVVFFWDKNRSVVLPKSSISSARGTAYRTGNECGGWGRIKIILDPSEHYRISEVPNHRWDGGKQVPYMQSVIDGRYLSQDDGSYFATISWGHRTDVIEDS